MLFVRICVVALLSCACCDLDSKAEGGSDELDRGSFKAADSALTVKAMHTGKSKLDRLTQKYCIDGIVVNSGGESILVAFRRPCRKYCAVAIITDFNGC